MYLRVHMYILRESTVLISMSSYFYECVWPSGLKDFVFVMKDYVFVISTIIILGIVGF